MKSYSPHRDTCCSGIVNSNLARGRCCGNQAFLPAQATCCEGRLTGVPSVRGEFCCGKTGYEPAVQLCCGNTLVEIRGRDLRCCCGDSGCRTYKTKSHVCCSNGHVMRKRGDRLCCAGKDSQRLYDPKTQVTNLWAANIMPCEQTDITCTYEQLQMLLSFCPRYGRRRLTLSRQKNCILNVPQTQLASAQTRLRTKRFGAKPRAVRGPFNFQPRTVWGERENPPHSHELLRSLGFSPGQ